MWKTSFTGAVDGLRAIGFLWIFQLHVLATMFMHSPKRQLEPYFRQAGAYSEAGYRAFYAVDVFNIISGYLQAYALFGEIDKTGTCSFVQFWKGRVMRLAPFYFMFLALCLLLHALVEPIPHVDNAWANFAFVNNFVPFQNQFMNHTWTQALEMQFTFVLPLYIGLFLSRRPGNHRPFLRATAMALAGSAVIRFLMCCVVHLSTEGGLVVPAPIHTLHWLKEPMTASTAAFYRFVYMPPWSRFSSYLCGVLVAYGHFNSNPAKEPVVRATNVRALLALLALAAALAPRLTSHDLDAPYPFWFASLYLSLNRLLFAAPVALLLFWCLDAHAHDTCMIVRGLNAFLSWKGWKPISRISYVGYIVHVLIIGGFQLAFANDAPLSNWSVWRVVAASWAVTYTVSEVCQRVIENPIQAWRRATIYSTGRYLHERTRTH